MKGARASDSWTRRQASACRGRVGRVRAGPKEMFDRFLCVPCGFARNSSSKIRELEKNFVSLQTSRRHGVPPCKRLRSPAGHERASSRCERRRHGVPPCKHANRDVPSTIVRRGRRTSYIKFMAIIFATDVHRLTRTDGQQYLVFYALMKGACGDSPMSYPAKRAKARALQRMRELALGNFLENSAHEKRRLSRKYLIFAVSMWWQGHQASNPLKLKAL